MRWDGQAFQALSLAGADLAVGVALAQYVSVPAGVVMAVFGVFVLLTAAYRAVRSEDAPASPYQVV